MRRFFLSRLAALSALIAITGGAIAIEAIVLAGPAAAQGEVQMPVPRPNPLRVPLAETLPPAPTPVVTDGPQPLNLLPEAGAPLDLLPAAPPPAPATPLLPQDVVLVAVLADGGQPIPDGVEWRVFAGTAGPDGAYPLVAEAEGGTARVRLAPGDYRVHAAFGRAGVAANIAVGPEGGQQTVVLNAGGLRLRALIGDDIPIPPADLRFEVYGAGDVDGGRPLVAENVQAGGILRLNAGPYQVVSYYGTTNAIVRADINVTAGILTDVTLYQQAARVTLKLVTVRGGEALANTTWSVVTEGGEIVFDSVSAFPSVVLAAGNYTAIAKHGEDVFQGPFTVVSGDSRDVEVLARAEAPAAVP